jgi:hypothetical protein
MVRSALQLAPSALEARTLGAREERAPLCASKQHQARASHSQVLWRPTTATRGRFRLWQVRISMLLNIVDAGAICVGEACHGTSVLCYTVRRDPPNHSTSLSQAQRRASPVHEVRSLRLPEALCASRAPEATLPRYLVARCVQRAAQGLSQRFLGRARVRPALRAIFLMPSQRRPRPAACPAQPAATTLFLVRAARLASHAPPGAQARRAVLFLHQAASFVLKASTVRERPQHAPHALRAHMHRRLEAFLARHACWVLLQARPAALRARSVLPGPRPSQVSIAREACMVCDFRLVLYSMD